MFHQEVEDNLELWAAEESVGDLKGLQNSVNCFMTCKSHIFYFITIADS